MKRKKTKLIYSLIIISLIFSLNSVNTKNVKIRTWNKKINAIENRKYIPQGYIDNLGGNRYRFHSTLGMQNIRNGSEYYPYLWFENNKTVKYQEFSLQFFDWYVVYRNNSQVLMDDMRFQIEYWSTQAGGRWNFLDLYNRFWYDPIINEESIILIQGYNDVLNSMNISYKCSNMGVKVDIDYISGEERILRFIWQLTGINGDLAFNQSESIFQFDSLIISLNDTDISKTINYDWEVANKKLSVYIENYTVGIGSFVNIDPTFSEKQTIDKFDFQNILDLTVYSTQTGQDWFKVGTRSSDRTYQGYLTFNTSITENISLIENVTMTLYVTEHWEGSNEYYGFGVYYNDSLDGGYWNETYANANDEDCFNQELYWNNTDSFALNGFNTNVSLPNPEIEYCLNNWSTLHNIDSSNRMYISFKFFRGDGMDTNGDDWGNFKESSETTANQRPTLTFDYLLEEEPTTTTTTTTTPTITITPTLEGSPDITGVWNPFSILSGFGLWIMDQGWILLVGCIFLFFLWKAISNK